MRGCWPFVADLSFNCIDCIEGLASLVNLTDLSLYGNNISCVEGLEGCTKLEVLSLGRNRISDITNVKRLRNAQTLRALTLDANPISSEELYRAYVITFVPQLKYLDYSLIDDEERAKAKLGGVSLEELQEADASDASASAAAAAAQEVHGKVSRFATMHMGAAVTAFDSILAADPSMQSLQRLHGVIEPLSVFHSTFVELAEQFKTAGSHRHKQIVREIGDFQAAAAAVVAEADIRTVEGVVGLRRHVKRVAMAMRSKTELSAAELEALRAHARELEVNLTEVELLAAEKVLGMIDMLETSLAELRALKLGEHVSFYRGMETALKSFLDDLSSVVKGICEAYLRTGSFPAELSDSSDVGIALQSKENAETLLKEASDSMEAMLIGLSEQARKGVIEMCATATTNARVTERERNRTRLLEIVRMRAAVESQLEGWAAQSALHSGTSTSGEQLPRLNRRPGARRAIAALESAVRGLPLRN